MKCKICYRQSNKRYCSEECKEEGELKKHLLRVQSHKCAKCGGQTKYSIRTYSNHLEKYTRNVYSFNKYCENCLNDIKIEKKEKVKTTKYSYCYNCRKKLSKSGYCSIECKEEHRIKNKILSKKYYLKNKKEPIKKICPHCNKEFLQHNKRQIYCDRLCKNGYFNRRNGLPNNTTSNK